LPNRPLKGQRLGPVARVVSRSSAGGSPVRGGDDLTDPAGSVIASISAVTAARSVLPRASRAWSSGEAAAGLRRGLVEAAGLSGVQGR